MIGQLGQDLQKAQARIFDHRVFVNAEIDTFLNNFELNRNDVEVETLFKVTESVGSLRYELTKLCIQLAQNNISEIDSNLKELLQGVQDFVEETKKEQLPINSIIQSRQEREARKLNILKDFEYKHQRLDSSFEEKEEEIAELYAGLKLKLNINT